MGEQVLHDKGLSRQDIHGVDRRTVTVRKRYDIAASLRRACAACGRLRLRRALSVASIVTGGVLAYTASHAVAIVTVALAFAAIGIIYLPDYAFEPPDPAFEISNTQGDGITDKEFAERLAIVKERGEYREELIEEKTDEARSKTDTPTVRMGGSP